MKLTSLQTIACTAALALMPSSFAFAQDFTLVWVSGDSLLETRKPDFPEARYPAVEYFRGILLRSLNNHDQARELVKLHSTQGTKPLASSRGVLTPLRSKNPEMISTRGAQSKISRNLGAFVQKETKGDFLPDSLRQGIRFNSGESSSATTKQPFMNGRPDLRYGLILRDIEPSKEVFKIAALDHSLDYQMVSYAPKATLNYEIGPVFTNDGDRRYTVPVPSPVILETSYIDMPPRLPSLRVRGRLAPSGLPTPQSPLPPQLLTLEQVEGYYTLEARLEKGIKPQSILHKFRVPLWSQTALREERDKNFETTRRTVENLLLSGPFSMQADHFLLEKRYQLGIGWREHRRLFEAVAHVPETALENDNFWPQHRWELKAEISF